MTKKTHENGGLLFGILILLSTNTVVMDNLVYIIIYMCGVIVGSVLPDIDKKGSTISKRLPITSAIVRKFTKHRYFTHSLLFLFLIYLLTVYITIDIVEAFVIGILVGCLSHVILDMISKEGVALLYPIKNKFSLGLVKTGSSGEDKINLLLVVINMAVLIKVVMNVIGI